MTKKVTDRNFSWKTHWDIDYLRENSVGGIFGDISINVGVNLDVFSDTGGIKIEAEATVFDFAEDENERTFNTQVGNKVAELKGASIEAIHKYFGLRLRAYHLRKEIDNSMSDISFYTESSQESSREAEKKIIEKRTYIAGLKMELEDVESKICVLTGVGDISKIAIDFDGVLVKRDGIPRRGGFMDCLPHEGAKEAVEWLIEEGHDLYICTNRKEYFWNEIWAWLEINKIPRVRVTNKKEPGTGIYLDDRAVRFTNWQDFCKLLG